MARVIFFWWPDNRILIQNYSVLNITKRKEFLLNLIEWVFQQKEKRILEIFKISSRLENKFKKNNNDDKDDNTQLVNVDMSSKTKPLNPFIGQIVSCIFSRPLYWKMVKPRCLHSMAIIIIKYEEIKYEVTSM